MNTALLLSTTARTDLSQLRYLGSCVLKGVDVTCASPFIVEELGTPFFQPGDRLTDLVVDTEYVKQIFVSLFDDEHNIGWNTVEFKNGFSTLLSLTLSDQSFFVEVFEDPDAERVNSMAFADMNGWRVNDRHNYPYLANYNAGLNGKIIEVKLGDVPAEDLELLSNPSTVQELFDNSELGNHLLAKLQLPIESGIDVFTVLKSGLISCVTLQRWVDREVINVEIGAVGRATIE